MSTGRDDAPYEGGAAARAQQRRATVLLAVIGAFLVVGFLVALAFVQGWLRAAPSAPSNTAAPTTTTCTATRLPEPKDVAVNVYNATDRAGLARTTAGSLSSQGFVVGAVADDPLKKTIEGVAEVRHGKEGAAKAKAVAARFPGATLVADDRSDDSIDVAIGAAFTAVVAPTATTAPC